MNNTALFQYYYSQGNTRPGNGASEPAPDQLRAAAHESYRSRRALRSLLARHPERASAAPLPRPDANSPRRAV